MRSAWSWTLLALAIALMPLGVIGLVLWKGYLALAGYALNVSREVR